jgi:pimeloyl-ACP methyl ester carboxylesterase
MTRKNSLKQILCFVLCLSLFQSLVFTADAAAQTRRGRTGGQASEETKCSGWRGKITYQSTKTSNSSRTWSNPPGGPKANGSESGSYSRIEKGEIILNGKDNQSTATLEIKEKRETTRQNEDCCWVNLGGCQKTAMPKRTEKVESTTSASGSGKASGDVYVSGSRYSFSFSLPDMKGRQTTVFTDTRSGYCDAANNKNNSYDQTSPDASFSGYFVKGEGTIDPNDPNQISGTFQPDKDTTITWSLTRIEGDCDDGDLSISDLKFEHHKFPNKNAWAEIEEYTVDGNRVRITARVSNSSKKAKSGTVTFKETKSGEVLGEKTVSVPAKGEREVELIWDTEGFAWSDDGENLSAREIEASLTNGETVTGGITVYPKPVILVHGLWSDASAWSEYQNYLNEAHSFAWRGYAVGADPENGRMNTGVMGTWAETNSIFQNAQELGKQIKAARTEMNAWHVDIVAHSMGGLISRFYIHSFMTQDAPDGRPPIKNLVMLGTPNEGSPCADLMGGTFDFLGKPVEALRQLRPSVVADFNSKITNRKNVKFSILAGFPVPRTCQEKSFGDGVVSIRSALWQIADRAFAPRVHTSLTGREDFFAFVKPRLAVGPKKARQTAQLEEEYSRPIFAGLFEIGDGWTASLEPIFAPVRKAAEPQLVSSKEIKAKAGETVEAALEIAGKGGVTFIAAPTAAVSLVAPDGEIKQTIEAGSAEAAEIFKTFYIDEAAPGAWKLRVENRGQTETSIVAAIWADRDEGALEIVQLFVDDAKRINLQAELTGTDPAANAASFAKISGTGGDPLTVELFDDGLHDDERPNDRIYGGQSPELKSGDYLIEISVAGRTAAKVVTIR